MAEGGKITGSGGPKEDKITKKIEDGSFIVPAENAKKAMDIGSAYLGWDDTEQSKRNYPGTKVKVSNGEVLFTPEEVNTLSYQGINLDSLAPNAEDKLNEGQGYKKGYKNGVKPDKTQWTSDWQAQNEGSIDDANAAYDAQYGTTASETKGTDEPKTFLQTVNDLVPDIAGAIQIGAAAVGNQKAGAMPDVNVSQYLKDLAAEQRKDSQYGLEPGAKSAMLSSIERDKRNTNNAIVNRGGTAGEVMSNLQSTLSTGIDKSLSVEMMDAAEKTKKKGMYAGTVGQMGTQDYDSKKVALDNWLKWQEVNAGLLSAGISNIVGVRKLRAELENQRKIGNNNVDWSKILTNLKTT